MHQLIASCYLAYTSLQENDVVHGIIDAAAFQEALLIEAAFGIAILTMIWVGFRSWLRHKERMSGLIADNSAERASDTAARIECMEARLNALERNQGDGTLNIAAPVAAPSETTGAKRVLSKGAASSADD